MEISELTAYASEKYQIAEQHKWADFPGFSVLAHPQSGKWIALLMRQWDSETGEELQKCDLKCGEGVLARYTRPYLAPPVRMRGNNWINISFDRRTERETVFALFDLAVAFGSQSGYLITLPSERKNGESEYHDTKLSFGPEFSGRPRFAASGREKDPLPERLRALKRLYDYGPETVSSRARNFYRQAQFMKDFEDDYPWTGPFHRYFPTYQDLTTRQLRGYFTWRTHVRRGIYEEIPSSAAYIYLYELLNGIGASGPEDVLGKLREFRTGFLDAGFGDDSMRTNLERWMFEYAVLSDLSPEQTAGAADPQLRALDEALSSLRSSREYTDDAVFEALCRFGRKTMKSSPAYADPSGDGKHLLCEAWRAACDDLGGENLFTRCFGKRSMRPWNPLSNAVCYEHGNSRDRDFVLDPSRSYHCRNGMWYVNAFEPVLFDRGRIQSFLRTADRMLRRYLKTGHYLQEKPEELWAAVYMESVIEADKKAKIEAARPRIEIDLSALDQIRQDAVITRESLLTDEERDLPLHEEDSGRDVCFSGGKEFHQADHVPVAEDFLQDDHVPVAEDFLNMKDAAAEKEEPVVPVRQTPESVSEIPLSSVEMQILQTLLAGKDPSEIIKANHQMTSIVADTINEALFDVFGDTVVLCEEDHLSLAEDYIEELEEYLVGKSNG